MPGQWPSFVSTSLWQTPQACTLMRTCPTPGCGISRSTICKLVPGLETCATFIVPIATAVVTINPPESLHDVAESSPFRNQRAGLSPYLKDDFHFDRRPERQAGDAVYQSARISLFTEDVLQKM